MDKNNYDLIIIGGGPGGYVAAERAGDAGLSVLLIEKEKLGGVCLNCGCIPTKSLLHTAKTYTHALEGKVFGVTAENVRYNFADAMQWKQKTVTTLVKGVEYLMRKSKVTVIKGEGSILSRNSVKVEDTVYEGRNIIIATGSSPFIPPVPGADSDIVKTSRQILELDKLPEKLVIIGGGVIGMEFASYFSAIGTEVQVVEMMPEVIPVMDKSLAVMLRKAMKNVKFHLSCRVTGISGKQVLYTDADGNDASIDTDMVLMSVGRRANNADPQFRAIGLDLPKTGIEVDEHMQTNLPGVYAIGDVTGKSLLAHSASRMGEVAVNHILGKADRMRYDAVPWVVYTMPEVAGCGLTEEEAAAAGYPIKSASVPMRVSGRFLAENLPAASGVCKIVADADTDRLLGVHLLGGAASEMIYGVAAMLENELRIKDIKEIIFPHPTVSEVIREAAWAME